MIHNTLVSRNADLEALSRFKARVDESERLDFSVSLQIYFTDQQVTISWNEQTPTALAIQIIEQWPDIMWRLTIIDESLDTRYAIAVEGEFLAQPIHVKQSQLIGNTHVHLVGDPETRGGFLADLAFAGSTSSKADDPLLALRNLAGRIYDSGNIIHIVLTRTPDIDVLLRLGARYPELELRVLGRVFSY